MATAHPPKTLREAILFFADYQNCRKAVEAIRWSNGTVACPTCGSENITWLETQRRYKCYGKHPKAQFSLKVGTIFEDSAIGLEKWLPALWLLVNCKNGISSYELARALGVTQKTAWFMLARLRTALHIEADGKFDGHVEADETYIGGRARNMHVAAKKAGRILNGAQMDCKVAVMGLLERHDDGQSRIRTRIIANTKRPNVQGTVRDHVVHGEIVHTDAHPAYTGLHADYVHNVIDHAERYVDGQIHTNGLENFWSLLKRALRGTYVSVEPFHLFRYLDEQMYRFNNRKMTDSDRFFAWLAGVLGKRLTYNVLTGSELPQTC